MGDDVKLLKVIIEYCGRIRNAMARFGDDEEDFLGDPEYQYACSFCITQIGETIKRLSQKVTDGHPEIPWDKIAGMRDFLAHRYGSVNLSTVWVTIKERIPELKDVCEAILGELKVS